MKRKKAMAKIRIDTTRTREIGQQFVSNSNRLAEIGRELQNAINSLDTGVWDGISRLRAELLLSRVRLESETVTQRLYDLGRKLVLVADTFEQEDSIAAQNMVEMPWVGFALKGGIGIALAAGGTSFAGGGGDGGSGGMSEVFAQGSGDQLDIQYSDVRQGFLGDCYLMAALAAVAKGDPEIIRNMIRDNGDGTFTVTFHTHSITSGWETKDVTVKAEDLGKYGQSTDNGELWPAIIEQAYAEWKGGSNPEKIEGGWKHNAQNMLAALTGVKGDNYLPAVTKDLGGKIQDALQKGNPVVVTYNPVFGDTPFRGDEAIVADHSCAIIGITDDQVTIYAQATTSEYTVSVNQLKTHAKLISISPIH